MTGETFTSVYQYNVAVTAICNAMFRLPSTPKFAAKRAEKSRLIDDLAARCVTQFGVGIDGKQPPLHCIFCRQPVLKNRPHQHTHCADRMVSR